MSLFSVSVESSVSISGVVTVHARNLADAKNQAERLHKSAQVNWMNGNTHMGAFIGHVSSIWAIEKSPGIWDVSLFAQIPCTKVVEVNATDRASAEKLALKDLSYLIADDWRYQERSISPIKGVQPAVEWSFPLDTPVIDYTPPALVELEVIPNETLETITVVLSAPVTSDKGDPTGTVDFSLVNGSTRTLVGSAQITGGRANISIPAPAPGIYTYMATYDGSPDFKSDVSPNATLVVDFIPRFPTEITYNIISQGEGLYLSFTVTSIGGPVPTGNITVTIGGADVFGVLNAFYVTSESLTPGLSSSTAFLTYPGVPNYLISIDATYNGDPHNYPSSVILPLDAQFDILATVTYDGQYLWTGCEFGNLSHNNKKRIAKINRAVPSPGVVTYVDLSSYSHGSHSVDVHQIRSDGNYVFACILSSILIGAYYGAHYAGYFIIIDKTTDAIVGHFQAVGGYRACDIKSVTFDGLGHVFVAQTPDPQFASGHPTLLHKFNISDILSAYPAHGTPIQTTELTHQFIETIDYGPGIDGVDGGVGHVWVTHGKQGDGVLTRVNAVTGEETIYEFDPMVGTNGTWIYGAVTVKYAFGNVWVGASPGPSSGIETDFDTTNTPILRFNPLTFPSPPLLISTPIPISVNGRVFGNDTNCMTFESDGTSLWFGAYDAVGHALVYDPVLLTYTQVNLPAAGTPEYFAFDGTSMWSVMYGQNRLVRIDSGSVDYTLDSFDSAIALSISPSSGPVTGGQLVTIQVNDSSNVTGVFIGGGFLSPTVVDGTHVSVVTDGYAGFGTFDVSLSAPGTAASIPLLGAYTYV